MKVLKGITLLVLAIGLAACGNPAENESPEKVIEKASVVLMINDEELLADTTIWTITYKTKFRASIGKVMSAEDTKVGDLITYFNEGDIMESYPSRGTLKTVTVLNDDYSLKVSSAISHFLEAQTEGDVLVFNILSIEDSILTAEMKLRDLEDDRSFTVEIDVDTKEYTLTENS